MNEEVSDVDLQEMTAMNDMTLNGFLKKYIEFQEFLKDCVNQIGELKAENVSQKTRLDQNKWTIEELQRENDQLKTLNLSLIEDIQKRQSMGNLREEMDVLQTELMNVTEQRDMIRTELMEVRNENDLLLNELNKNQKAMEFAKNVLQSNNMNGIVNSLPEFSRQMVLNEDKANSMTAFGSLAEMQGLRLLSKSQSKEDTYHSTRMASGQTSEETYFSAIGSHRSSLTNGATGVRPKIPQQNGVQTGHCSQGIKGPVAANYPNDNLNETLITRTTESSDFRIDENNNLKLKHVKVPTGRLTPVRMAFYVSPTDFWLQPNPLKVNNYIHIIQVKQLELAQKPNSNLTAADITVGMYCAAIYSEDGYWYRAQVINITYENSVERDSIKSVLVLYIDWGNTEERPLSKIMRLSLDLTERKQAVHCYLQGYGEKDTKWPKKLIDHFEELFKDKRLNATFCRCHKINETLDSVIYPIDLLIGGPDEMSNIINLLPLLDEIVFEESLAEENEQPLSSPVPLKEQSANTSETLVYKTQVNGHSTGDLARNQNKRENKNLELKSQSNQNCATNSNHCNRVSEVPNRVPKSMPHLSAKSVTNNEINVRDNPRISWPNVTSLDSCDGLIVEVAYISSPSDFYVHINDVRFGTAQLEDLEEQLNQFYSKERSFSRTQASDVTPGSFWVCPYNSDNQWYRCRVLRVIGEDKVVVNYVDYGNEELVDISDLRTLTRQFANYPAMAVKCRLSNVSALDSDKWSEESKKYFYCLIEDETPLTAFIAKKPEDYNFDSFLDVFLWTNDKDTNEDILINLLLVVNKYALTDNKEWVQEAERCLREKTPPGELMSELIPKINSKVIFDSLNGDQKPETSSKRVKSSEKKVSNKSTNEMKYKIVPELSEGGDEFDPMVADAICDDNNYKMRQNDAGIAALGFKTDDRRTCKYYGTPKGCRLQEYCSFLHMDPEKRFEINDTEHELFEIADIDIKIGSFVVIKVSQIESPFSFYGVLPYGPKDLNGFELNEDCPEYEDLQKISEALKIRYSKQLQDNRNVFPAEGSLVAFRDESDSYYRGRVIAIDFETKMCTIFNIDWGVLTIIHRNSIFKLHPTFTQLPAQAILCSLNAVSPLNGTDWDKQSIDGFYDMVNQRVFGAHIMYGQTDAKFSVELIDRVGEDQFLISDKLIEQGFAKNNNSLDSSLLKPNNPIDSDEQTYDSDIE